MKKRTKKFLSLTIAAMTVFLGNSFKVTNANAETTDSKHTLWVIGDSTVSSFNDNYYYPRYGYGTQLQNYIDSSEYNVKNIALSGRSSKSYTEDPEYQTLLEGMKNGDYLIIGFGHNDEKPEVARYTNPNGDYTTEGSFENSLYENYIKQADDAGCKVILCTPIVRRSDSGVWTDSNLHITSTTEGKYEGGDYPQAIRDLGTDLDIPVIDMTSITKNVYDTLGASETLYLHAWTSSNPATVDNTHTNIYGAKYNSYLIAKEIKEMNIDSISNAIIEENIEKAPSKEENLVVNPNYVEKEYDSNLKNSELWSDVGIWKGTVFGNVGDGLTKDNFSLGKDDNGDVRISVKNNKGKIASNADGLAMYYYKIPVGSTFSLSADAKINSLALNNQVSFGLMARDDMYIDYSTTDLLGDYVTAAPLKLADEAKWNCFARKSGALTQGNTINNTSLNEGDTVKLKIESNSDGYACTFGNENTVTGGFDFALTSIDSEYVYVGMFVARNADITFSNIKLIVDGQEVKDESNSSKDDTIDDTDKGDTVITPDDDNKDEVDINPGNGNNDDANHDNNFICDKINEFYNKIVEDYNKVKDAIKNVILSLGWFR